MTCIRFLCKIIRKIHYKSRTKYYFGHNHNFRHSYKHQLQFSEVSRNLVQYRGFYMYGVFPVKSFRNAPPYKYLEASILYQNSYNFGDLWLVLVWTAEIIFQLRLIFGSYHVFSQKFCKGTVHNSWHIVLHSLAGIRHTLTMPSHV